MMMTMEEVMMTWTLTSCGAGCSWYTSARGWLQFRQRCPASTRRCWSATLKPSACESTTTHASEKCYTRPSIWWSSTSTSGHWLSTCAWTRIDWKPPTTSQFFVVVIDSLVVTVRLWRGGGKRSKFSIFDVMFDGQRNRQHVSRLHAMSRGR